MAISLGTTDKSAQSLVQALVSKAAMASGSRIFQRSKLFSHVRNTCISGHMYLLKW